MCGSRVGHKLGVFEALASTSRVREMLSQFAFLSSLLWYCGCFSTASGLRESLEQHPSKGKTREGGGMHQRTPPPGKQSCQSQGELQLGSRVNADGATGTS